MTVVVLHIVQAFKKTEVGVVAAELRLFRSAAEADAAVQVLMQTHSGVAVWSRRFDPGAGTYGKPEETMRYGFIPDWFEASLGLNKA